APAATITSPRSSASRSNRPRSCPSKPNSSTAERGASPAAAAALSIATQPSAATVPIAFFIPCSITNPCRGGFGAAVARPERAGLSDAVRDAVGVGRPAVELDEQGVRPGIVGARGAEDVVLGVRGPRAVLGVGGVVVVLEGDVDVVPGQVAPPDAGLVGPHALDGGEAGDVAGVPVAEDHRLRVAGVAPLLVHAVLVVDAALRGEVG